jgi:hypothetical protein
MLFNCNPGCSGKRGTTSGSVDVEQDEVVCDYCGETLPISSFVKDMMKRSGKIRKKVPKPFQFDCKTCEKSIETKVSKGKLVGKGCDGDCKFDVSNYTVHAMKNLQDTSKGSDDE